MSAFSSWLLGTSFRFGSRVAKRRFDAHAQHPGEVNQQVLWRILKRHRDTEFGRLHRFGSLRTVEEYRREVPLATYEDFRPYMDRIARGEQNVLTSDRVVSMGLSSGTTGHEKRIPMTGYARWRAGLPVMLVGRAFVADAIPDVNPLGRGLMLFSARLRNPTEGGLPTGALTALAATAIVQNRRIRLVSPAEAFYIPRATDALYVHLLFGLAERSLEYINAPFASGMLDLFHVLENQGAALMEDLARGTLRRDLEMPPELRAAIEAKLTPRPELAQALSRELAQGLDGIGPRLWPNLKYVSTISGGTFSVYTEKLRRYLGALPIFSSGYAATEGFLGVGMKPNTATYALMPTSVFFEFIPAAELDEPAPSTRLLDELKVGERYEVVLTNYSGLYRYRLGDVIQVADHYGRLPVVEVLHRRGGLLNIIGEKTSEHAAREALKDALSSEGLEMIDFTTLVDMEAVPQRYVFFVELDERVPALDEARMSERLEEALCRANPFYETLRSRLGKAVLHRVRPGTFRELREVLVQRGASPSQVKIPRVVPEGPHARFMREHRV